MRVVFAGAEITDAVVDVIDTLQNSGSTGQYYLDSIDRMCRQIMLSPDVDAENAIEYLRALTLIRADLATLITPPDADLEENDTPLIEA